MFELLAGCFFNSIWLICSAACYFLLRYAFSFVSLPFWLEGGITAAISFWVGLTGMFTVIEIFVNKNGRAEYVERLKGMTFLFGLPTLASCAFAIVLHLFLATYQLNTETEKWVVGLSTCALWSVIISVSTNRLERKSKQESDEYYKQRRRK